VVRKGDARGGAVLIKVLNRRDGQTRLYASATRGDGEQVWMRPIGAEAEADIDAYIERTVKFDPDLWVIEIDDAKGRHFLVEPVEGD
jgi:hypothetical protein